MLRMLRAGNLLVKFGTEMTVLEHYQMIPTVSKDWEEYRKKQGIQSRKDEEATTEIDVSYEQQYKAFLVKEYGGVMTFSGFQSFRNAREFRGAMVKSNIWESYRAWASKYVRSRGQSGMHWHTVSRTRSFQPALAMSFIAGNSFLNTRSRFW